jgi:hypothetical protein
MQFMYPHQRHHHHHRLPASSTHAYTATLLLLPRAAQSQADPPRSAALYEALKDDSELAPVFEDVKANGPAALQK